MDLDNWRKEINELDQKLLELLNRRASVALRVGESKKASGLDVCDHTREHAVIERMCSNNPGPLDERAIVELFRAIIHESRRIQTLAARTACAVSRPDLQIIRHRFQALDIVELLARARFGTAAQSGGFFQQIGTPDTAHKQAVAREQPHRLRCM